MSIARSVTTNTLYQLIGKGVGLIIGLRITQLLTQLLPMADFGYYTIFTSLVIQIAAITEWGTGFIAVRAASQSKFNRNLLFSNLLLLRLASLSLALIIILQIRYFQFPALPPQLYTLTLIMLIPLTIKNVCLSIFQAVLKFQYTAIVENVANIIYLTILTYLMSSSTLTLQSATLTLTFSTFAALAVALIFATRYVIFQPTYSPTITKYLLKESLPMGTQLLMFSLYERFDTYLLQYFKGEVTVAIYGLAYKLYGIVVLLAAYTMNSLYPIIAQASKQKLTQLYYRAFHLSLILAAAATFATIFIAPYLITFINPDYQASVLPLQVLSIGITFTYINHLAGYTYVAIHRQTTFMYIAIIALVFNITTNLIFIPQYGYLGAAATTAATEGLISLISIIILARQQQLKPQIFKFPETLSYFKHQFQQTINRF